MISHQALVILTIALSLSTSTLLLGNSLSADSSYNTQRNRQPSNSREGLLLTIQSTKRTYPIGEPVLISLNIKNITHTPRNLDLGVPFANYNFEMSQSRHEGIQKLTITSDGTKVIERNQKGMCMLSTLHPGRSRATIVDLTQLYEINSPGEYQVTASREVPTLTNTSNYVMIKSNILKINVVTSTPSPKK